MALLGIKGEKGDEGYGKYAARWVRTGDAGIDSKLFQSCFFWFPYTDVPPVLLLCVLINNY